MAVSTTVRSFVHLRVHSHYSLGVGLSSPENICRSAFDAGYDSIAVTDINSTFGYVEFHLAAKAVGIRPIYGTLLPISETEESEGAGDRVIVLARTPAGLRNVATAASICAMRRERKQSFSLADLEKLTDGVTAIYGYRQVADRDVRYNLRDSMVALRTLFGEHAYVEVSAEDEFDRASEYIAIAREIGVAPVLVGDVRFAGTGIPRGLDMLAGYDEPTSDQRVYGRPVLPGSGRRVGLPTVEEMSRLYADMPEAYSNAAIIASRVEGDLFDSFGCAVDPVTLTDDGACIEKLKLLLENAFDDRFGSCEGYPKQQQRRRMAAELKLIAKNGLARTLLVFHDIISVMQAAGVEFGPSTGLGVQSLCAYLLGITRFNPYEADDHFEPSLGARAITSTLDIQLVPEDRPPAVASLGRLFAGAGIGYVPALEHVTSSRALRIAAVALGENADEVEEAVRIAGRSQVSLKDLCDRNRAMGHLYRKSPALRRVVTHAASIEGLPFGFVRSKRTIIVSPRPLRDYLGYKVTPDRGELFVQSTRDAFPTGEVQRLEVTTLNALGICREASDLQNWHPDGSKVGHYRIVHAEISDGTYLIDSPATRGLASEFRIVSFDDLVMFLALMRYRPGEAPLSRRIRMYIQDAERQPVAGRAGPVLKPTHGWLLFDDQLRDIVISLTALAADGASDMIHAMRDVSPGHLADLRARFMASAVEAGTPMEEAVAWFPRLIRQCGRTISRQHVIADAMIVDKMLRTHELSPARYIAATLSRLDGNRRKNVLESVNEALLLPPDLNRSHRFYREEGGRIRPPLSSIEGVGEGAARAIRRRARTHEFNSYNELQQLVAEGELTAAEADALRESATMAGEPLSAPPAPEARPAPETDRKTRRPRKKGVGTPGAGSSQIELGLIEPRPGPGRFGKIPDREQIGPEFEENSGNKRVTTTVVSTLAEFYPQPIASHVELAGRIRDLQSLKTSSGNSVSFFVLYDSSAYVRTFAPWQHGTASAAPHRDGENVIVRGTVRVRNGQKVCEAMEVTAVEGGTSDGETVSDHPPAGNP